jgi:glutamyl-tRNA reductase
MSITVLGISHKTASLDLREKLVFDRASLEEALPSLLAHPEIQEAVILSTCNRTEIYCVTAHGSLIFDWLSAYKKIDSANLLDSCYTFQNLLAVEHLMRVASGLDSLVLGEPQILGQIKTGFAQACFHQSVGAHLSHLFRQVFSVAKEVRSTTAIGVCPVSVASTTVKYIGEYLVQHGVRQTYELADANILLIGSGATVKLMLRYLSQHSPNSITVAGRCIEKVKQLVQAPGMFAITLDELPYHLAKNHIIISATSSEGYVLTKKHLPAFTQEGVTLLVDVAVPRDISPDVTSVDRLHVATIDDLKTTMQDNMNRREHAAAQAQELIDTKAREYMLSLRGLDAADVIRRFRQHIEVVCQAELTRALQQNNVDACYLTKYTKQLANTLKHLPCKRMRSISTEGRVDLLQAVEELFDLK